jgi:hypothetical protein
MLWLSVEDLIAQNRQAFERFRHPEILGVEPRLDPVLNRLIEERLRAMDRTKGVILDGYPHRRSKEIIWVCSADLHQGHGAGCA